jgi:hypothetical protein
VTQSRPGLGIRIPVTRYFNSLLEIPIQGPLATERTGGKSTSDRWLSLVRLMLVMPPWWLNWLMHCWLN